MLNLVLGQSSSVLSILIDRSAPGFQIGVSGSSLPYLELDRQIIHKMIYHWALMKSSYSMLIPSTVVICVSPFMYLQLSVYGQISPLWVADSSNKNVEVILWDWTNHECWHLNSNMNTTKPRSGVYVFILLSGFQSVIIPSCLTVSLFSLSRIYKHASARFLNEQKKMIKDVLYF